MKDLTKGYPAKVIILFAIPLLLGNVFQQLYNITDSKIVSMYINTDALAAVGATSVVVNMLLAFCIGMTQGFGILISRFFGAGDFDSLKKAVAASSVQMLVIAVALTLFGMTNIETILRLLNTPPDIMEASLSYVRIIIVGVLFVSLYNLTANILRAVGNSTTPLICLVVSVVLNIILDIYMINFLKMGIEGAAWATVISQAVAAVLCLMVLLTNYGKLIPQKEDFKPVKKIHIGLFTSGLSMAFMACLVNIGTVVLQGAINDLGKDIVAGHIAGRRVFDILMCIIYSFAFAMNTYVSQNYGAGCYKRIRQGVKHAIILDTVLTTVLAILCFTLGEYVVKWVASTDNTVIMQAGCMYIRIGILFFYVLGPLFILRCSLQGMEHKIVPVISSFLELLVKVLSAMILVPRLQYLGVSLTEPISWIIMIIPLIIVYVITVCKPEFSYNESN